MIFIAGITIAFLLEFLLFSKKNKSVADLVLATWMFFIGMHLFFFYIQYAGIYIRFPFLIGLILPLPLVHGPFLFIYVSILTNQVPRKTVLLYLHLLPPILMYLYLISFFSLPGIEKIEVIKSGGAGYEAFNSINIILIYVSGITYVCLSQVKLQKHKRKIREEFSDLERINLNWLQYLILGIGFIWIVVLAVNLLPFDIPNNEDSDVLVFISVVIFVLFLGFFGLKQTTVFVTQYGNSDANSLVSLPESDKLEIEKYAKSGLKPTDADVLHKKLTEYMIQQKPFLDSQLSLSKLGKNFGVHTNYLSQVINEREKMNFYDYINSYRINEFKRMVSDPRNKRLTILAMALECGFNSKSAFNNCFKKFTNQTPSEFLKVAQ